MPPAPMCPIEDTRLVRYDNTIHVAHDSIGALQRHLQNTRVLSHRPAAVDRLVCLWDDLDLRVSCLEHHTSAQRGIEALSDSTDGHATPPPDATRINATSQLCPALPCGAPRWPLSPP